MKDNHLRPFVQHGIVFTGETETQAIGTCRFCGKEKHFYVHRTEQVWDCKSCGRAGNLHRFLTQCNELYRLWFRGNIVQELFKNRAIKPATFKAWGVGWSGSFYSIPVSGTPDGRLVNIKRYTIGQRSLATSSCRLAIICPMEVTNSETIWLCEGEWDAMALWQALRHEGNTDDVFAAPGASAFPQDCGGLFSDKRVIVCYDNDTAGETGSQRVYEMLSTVAKDLSFIHWPIGLPVGFDVRDFCVQSRYTGVRAAIRDLLRTEPPGTGRQGATGNEREPVKGRYDGVGASRTEACSAFQKWLYMDDTNCLDILFGTLFANRLDADPLWMFLVAPSGGMKSELLMSLSGCPGLIETTSLTNNALISGFPGVHDPSLIPKLNNKVLVIKDFTPILSMQTAYREEILGTLRDIYDGTITKRYGNGLVRHYKSRFGIIAGVTGAVEVLGNTATVLGERFVRYRIKESGSTSEEDTIIQAMLNSEVNSAMRDELRAISYKVVNWDHTTVKQPAIDSDMYKKIARLAMWVEWMRGVVIREQYTQRVRGKYTSIGTRLGKQFQKLAWGIGIFRRVDKIDEDIFNILIKTAKSTSPSGVQEVIKHLYLETKRFGTGIGVPIKDLADLSSLPIDTVRAYMEDFALLKRVYVSGGYCTMGKEMYETIKVLGLYKYKRKKREAR